MVIAAVVVVLDQITKHWALNSLDDRDIEVFWTLQFNLAFNTGMAFSRGEGLGPVIAVVALVVVVFFLVRLGREGGRLAAVATGLIVGGAIGNIIDRAFRGDGILDGAVVDFIDFQWFPIFNIADMGITIGGALLVLSSVLPGRPT
jgi:signal peptidase II